MGARRYFLGVIAVSAVIQPGSAVGEWICWTADQDHCIECAQPDGSQLVRILTGLGSPMGIAVDHTNGKLYWADRDPDQIRSVDLSGTAFAATVVPLGSGESPRGMAVANSIGKIYWVAEDLGKIQRANLDGTQVEDLPILSGSFFDVEVDDSAGVLYWTDGAQILRGNLDGSSVIVTVPDAGQPYYLALDFAAGKMYWTDISANEIGRSNLDGTDLEVPGPIHDLASKPIGITLDADAGKVYWTIATGGVQRANLDGSNVEMVLEGLDSTWDITLVGSIPTPAPVPAVSGWGTLILSLAMLAVSTVIIAQRRGVHQGAGLPTQQRRSRL